jgi:hypothetical protein
VWSVVVVMSTKTSKTRLRRWSFRISSLSRHSDRTVRTNHSATPFAYGARNGVRIISGPLSRNRSSKPSVNFWSRSRIKKRNGFWAFGKRPCQLPGLLCHPGCARVPCAARDVHASTAQFDEEGHVQFVAAKSSRQ